MARRRSRTRKRINVKKAIKRPGALSGRAKRAGRSTHAQARHDKAHGSTLQKRQANFYLNVLKGGRKKGRKKKR
jgi:hypothetical protein